MISIFQNINVNAKLSLYYICSVTLHLGFLFSIIIVVINSIFISRNKPERMKTSIINFILF